MNLSKPLICLLASLLLGAAGLSGQTPEPQGEVQEHADEIGPVARAMGELHGSMRRMKRLAKAGDDKEGALAVLREMQDCAMAVLVLEPPTLEDQDPLTGDEHGIWVAEYRRHIVKLVDKLLELELAVLRGHMKVFSDGYGELSQIRNTGHYDYQ